MGTVAKLIWKQKRVLKYTNLDGGGFLDVIGHDLNILWDLAIRPLLFGSIGAAFDIVIPKEILFKCISIVFIGLCVRLPTAYMSVSGRDLTTKERLFVASAWMPKATVQAALCSLPLSTIKEKLSGSSNFDELIVFGEIIMTISTLAIIITAPIGLLSIQYLGPLFLTKQIKDAESSTPREHHDKQPEAEQSGSAITP